MKEWYIMNASTRLFDGKGANLEDLRKIWKDGCGFVVQKGESKVLIVGAGKYQDYNVKINDFVRYIIDTGLGCRNTNKPPMKILGMMNFTKLNYQWDSNSEYNPKKKYLVWVFK